MSAMSGPSRNRTVSMGSGRSSRRTVQGQPYAATTTMPMAKNLRLFDPCAATASMFLYAQGNSVVCCHHDTLTIERRFSRHTEEVQLLAVDTQSDHGAGRFIVSYDAGQTAIVWDLLTGNEVARFASYDHITVAAWMKNGNVAFGNVQGNIIQFEPTTSEHISTRTLDQIAITAIAPSSDCRTFAIGYQNGNLLVATLQPRFTILHHLTTTRPPSPIVTLSWHASSSRQKSDMLAVQTHDGDLRVWSVAKSHNTDDPAKVVRILRKTENYLNGPNWMGWSKNGRIIQFCDSETLSWDVRTKHVTYDSIPTLEHVRGLAVFGPGANLFTLGPNNTVQQFDLNSPAIMVANVQHPANLLPPSPPVSIEEATEGTVHSSTTIHTSESESSSITFDMGISESDDDHLSPYARLARGHQVPDSGNEMYDSTSMASSRSGFSRPSGGSRTPGRYASSMRSRPMTENTYISAGSSLRSSTVGKQKDLDAYSMGYSLATTSVPSIASTSQSRHKPSRLRNEVPRSPDDNKVHDLFKYTRTRLSDIPYKHPIGANYARLTNDDLHRQMLSTIFGWNKGIEDLVRDEMSRHPQGSASRVLLAKWLGDIDTDIMGTSSENMTSSDWMLLALSGIGGQASQHKLGRTYVQRLLETGDIHAAVTIMLGMGDYNDAIEIYNSHKRYMEALILTCMAFPSVWERQAAIIKKWGEWAVQHGQQQLAIRCFACTDQESTEPWASPSAAQLTFQSMNSCIPEVLSPPLSPPGLQRGPQRSIAKTSALKLITSFGDQTQKSKFFSQGDGATDATPVGESQEATTAFIRPSNNSRFNTPTTARPGGPSFGRNRLPSIGEMPSEFNREALQAKQKQTLPIEQLESRLSHKRSTSGGMDQLLVGNALQRAATASPMMMRDGYQRIVRPMGVERPPSPDANVMRKMEQARSNIRNGSRDRIPTGVSMKLQSLDQRDADTASEHSVASSARYHWPSRRRGPASVASSITSASSAGRSLRFQAARNREDYIHSLDAAQQYSKKQRSRHASRERSRGRHGSRDRSNRSREVSENRGWANPKRSPTSPLPMSPEDLINLSTPKQAEMEDPSTVRKASGSVIRPGSRASSRGGRRRSPEGRRRPPALEIRGRSKGRDSSRQRSPSSPVPMPASAGHFQGSEDEEDFRLAMEAQEQFRAKHSRSVTRGLNSPALNKRDRSESRRRRANSESHNLIAPLMVPARATSTEHAGDLRQMKDERQRKKEQAARDLEERRKSLAQRPQAPQILHPTVFSPALRVGVEMDDPKEDLPPRCATEPPKSMYARNGPAMGLPATPKAMRLVLESDQTGNGGSPMPEMPPIPSAFAQKQSPQVSPKASPKKEQADLLTLLPSTVYQLPSTVYQPPVRPPIPRSMSAPIPDDPPSHYRRKASVSGLGGIEEGVVGERRRSHEEKIPPPPPPPPAPPAPLLRELQHLAIPPPPPPAPLPFGQRPHNAGAVGSGMIEIVMDDDEGSGGESNVNVPAPLSISHTRGSSMGDHSISGRFSKATERLRSASRTRKDVRPMRSQVFEAPYESIPTGLHRSEMI